MKKKRRKPKQGRAAPTSDTSVSPKQVGQASNEGASIIQCLDDTSDKLDASAVVDEKHSIGDEEIEASLEGEPQLRPRADRRDFLARSGMVLTGICGAVAASGAVRLALPDVDETHKSRFAIGRLKDFKMNTLTWLRDKELYVMRDERGIGAFSSKCTHLGCTVQRTEEGFSCPCHGARFNVVGQVVHGPAIAPLPWYRVVLYDDGQLWVHLDSPLDVQGTTPLLPLSEG